MTISEKKTCPKCNNDFECQNVNINDCHCSQVIINEEMSKYLHENYKDCLCNHCLLAINKILKNKVE